MFADGHARVPRQQRRREIRRLAVAHVQDVDVTLTEQRGRNQRAGVIDLLTRAGHPCDARRIDARADVQRRYVRVQLQALPERHRNPERGGFARGGPIARDLPKLVLGPHVQQVVERRYGLADQRIAREDRRSLVVEAGQHDPVVQAPCAEHERGVELFVQRVVVDHRREAARVVDVARLEANRLPVGDPVDLLRLHVGAETPTAHEAIEVDRGPDEFATGVDAVQRRFDRVTHHHVQTPLVGPLVSAVHAVEPAQHAPVV